MLSLRVESFVAPKIVSVSSIDFKYTSFKRSNLPIYLVECLQILRYENDHLKKHKIFFTVPVIGQLLLCPWKDTTL